VHSEGKEKEDKWRRQMMMIMMMMKHTRVNSSKKKTREGEQRALADDAYDQGH
jgi:hypothetical protein